jgi:hypothetical protein
MLRDMVSRYKKVLQLFSSVADSNPDPSDPYVFGPPGPDPDPLVRGTYPDPDSSIFKW